MGKHAIYWFSHDLRIDDNLSFLHAACSSQTLHCVYCLDPALRAPTALNSVRLGAHRLRFIRQSLVELQAQLAQLGHSLHVYAEAPLPLFKRLVHTLGIDSVYHSIHAGLNERRLWQQMQQETPHVHFHATHTHTLFDAEQLPCALHELPPTFSQFRKRVQETLIKAPINVQKDLPGTFRQSSPPRPAPWPDFGTDSPGRQAARFPGGCQSGQQHLKTYFSSDAPSHYKETRNALDDWSSSTKFSAWLAQGCLSPRQIMQALRDYEAQKGANASTEWIYVELLWREYFQWYAHAHGARLFQLKGIRGRGPLTSFYGERFQRWCQGNTPFPIVNACMKQLNATGYLSNRGRQLAASCFVNELGLDWRYGAAYFEQQLIDYDVASNWGNWQYLAGVGADPRGQRQFNLDKQAATYDPDGAFVRAWQGQAKHAVIDSVDAADWPILPEP